MYNKIVNPNTNRLVNINSKLGKTILKNYVIYNIGGSSSDSTSVEDDNFKSKDKRTKLVNLNKIYDIEKDGYIYRLLEKEANENSPNYKKNLYIGKSGILDEYKNRSLLNLVYLLF